MVSCWEGDAPVLSLYLILHVYLSRGLRYSTLNPDNDMPLQRGFCFVFLCFVLFCAWGRVKVSGLAMSSLEMLNFTEIFTTPCIAKHGFFFLF